VKKIVFGELWMFEEFKAGRISWVETGSSGRRVGCLEGLWEIR
jgi:hypothetical protein